MIPKSTKLPLVGVIIVNWNDWQNTCHCIESIRTSGYKNFKIYVIDNESSDNSIAMLQKFDPSMQVHESGGNIGWAAGNNFGIRVAIKEGCTNFLLLNPDIILDQNMIGNLVAASHEYPDAALFGAVVLSKTNRNWIEFGGSYIDKKSGFPSYVSKNTEEFDLLPNTERVPVVKGCAMMITELGIERIGMFDESYFLNFDETDWCFKALKRKYDTILVKDSIVYHQGAVSFEGTDSPLYRYFIARNRLIFAKNHKDVVNRVIAWRASLWEFKRAIIKKDLTIFCKLLLEIAIFIAINDYIFGNYGDCPRIIRKISKKYNSLTKKF